MYERHEQIPNLCPRPKDADIGNVPVNLEEFRVEPGQPLDQAIADLYTQTLPTNPHDGKPLELLQASMDNAENYSLRTSPERVTVSAASRKGFRNALRTLQQVRDGSFIPELSIVDGPALGMRGFHINFNDMHQLTFHKAKRLLHMASEFKLNTVLVEYGSRFPFRSHPEICSSGMLSVEEVEEFVALARNLDVDIIPLQQCFGHLEYALNHPVYAHLREAPGMDWNPQLCPLKNESFAFFKDLATEIIEMHPGSNIFHIGADETIQLGECPECAKVASAQGKEQIYIDYVNKVCDWIREKSLRPAAWDDMFCSHPNILNELHRPVMLFHWDYWTSSSPSPFVWARPAGLRLVHDRFWSEPVNRKKLSDLERHIMDTHSSAVDLEDVIGSVCDGVFRKYMGPSFPRRINPFPYLEYYRDKGFNAVGVPHMIGGANDFQDGLTNYRRHLDNIREFGKACITSDAEGLITSAWFNFPPEIMDLGIMATAEAAWHG